MTTRLVTKFRVVIDVESWAPLSDEAYEHVVMAAQRAGALMAETVDCAALRVRTIPDPEDADV
jgi:hypothetical protein